MLLEAKIQDLHFTGLILIILIFIRCVIWEERLWFEFYFFHLFRLYHTDLLKKCINPLYLDFQVCHLGIFKIYISVNRLQRLLHVDLYTYYICFIHFCTKNYRTVSRPLIIPNRSQAIKLSYFFSYNTVLSMDPFLHNYARTCTRFKDYRITFL